jgi:hypothetical protein
MSASSRIAQTPGDLDVGSDVAGNVDRRLLLRRIATIPDR